MKIDRAKFALLCAATAAIPAPIIPGLLTRQSLAQSKADTSRPLVSVHEITGQLSGTRGFSFSRVSPMPFQTRLKPRVPGYLAMSSYFLDTTLAFEVASIKPTRNPIGPNTFDIPPGGERFSATNSPLRLLIMIAYDVRAQSVSGGPGWVNTDTFDIEAKAEHPASRQQINLMLQSLLAERFNLRFHRETKEVPVYVLTAENYRTHLRENTSGGELRVSRGNRGQMVFENAPISQVTWFLSVRLRSDVEDKTGLTGKYDFELTPMPTGPETADQYPKSAVFMAPGSDGPSVFGTLIKEQLGLKLTATKGPIGLLVIDHAEKPSAN